MTKDYILSDLDTLILELNTLDKHNTSQQLIQFSRGLKFESSLLKISFRNEET